MAKYSYLETDKSASAASWIRKLQKINPVSLASAHHTEIHFTEPKEAEVQAVLAPHVTFISGRGTTHWYMKNQGGSYGVEYGGVQPHENESKIAKEVIADAVLLNWIKPAAQKAVVDDDGFQAVESKGHRKTRMKTDWQT